MKEDQIARIRELAGPETEIFADGFILKLRRLLAVTLESVVREKAEELEAARPHDSKSGRTEKRATRTAEVGKWLNEKDLSEITYIPLSTLRLWRHQSRGPKYYKFNRRVKYKLQEVLDWMESKKVEPHHG